MEYLKLHWDLDQIIRFWDEVVKRSLDLYFQDFLKDEDPKYLEQYNYMKEDLGSVLKWVRDNSSRVEVPMPKDLRIKDKDLN